jgi:3-deoxy-7-phosphoheptulonate synthase
MKELLVSKKSGESISINVKGVNIGGGRRVIISGPCSVEDYDTMLEIGLKLKDMGIDILRGGAFKPRTSPYDFQGLEYEGLKILYQVGKEVGLPVVTEIMDTRDVEGSIDYTDIIQIGSRNMYNYSLLKEVGRARVPVILKRGISATISEWVNAAEYIMAQGNINIILCERGIRTFEDYTRNTLDLNTVAVIKEKYRIPIIVDPSHGTGRRELVFPMSVASVAAGADGLMIESHTNPDCALSDSKQTISMEMLKSIVHKVREIEEVL